MALMKTAAALAICFHASSVTATDLGAPIVGCSKLDCPLLSKTTSADCRVADRSFSGVGLANFESSLAPDDFTWTKGVEIYENVNPNTEFSRVYEANFYLGSPQGFDLVADATSSGFGACALFFTRVSNRVSFPGKGVEKAVGTCEMALSADCVSAILEQASIAAAAARSDSPSVEEKCETLLSDFRENLASQCSPFATADMWQGVEGRELTGPNAPKPLTEAENATSNCHPTLPRSNSLTRVAAFNVSATSRESSIHDNVYAITPILTVFFPMAAGSGAPVLRQPEAHLTCLKVLGGTQADDNGRGESGAQGLLVSRVSKVVLLECWFWAWSLLDWEKGEEWHEMALDFGGGVVHILLYRL